jgi:DNA-binding response OmpR family regulator
VHILIADDDPISCEFLSRSIRAKTTHTVEVVRDGASALEKIRESGPYDVLLLDWLMPNQSGVEVCHQVRLMTGIKQPYISLVSAKTLHEEVLEGLAAGADDFIPKPVVATILLGRLAAIARWRATGNNTEPAVVDALRAAVVSGDGELIVATDNVNARIFLHEGRIAWIHLSEHPDGLLEILHNQASLNADDVREVIAECRRSGARLTDTLVSFGLLDRATLRVALLGWMRRQLGAILGLQQPRTLFVPKKRAYAEELLFELDEIVPSLSPGLGSFNRPLSVPPPSAPLGGPASGPPLSAGTIRRLELRLDSCAGAVGVSGAAVLDRRTGEQLGKRGLSLSQDVVWAQLHSFNVLDRQESIDALLIETRARLHLVATFVDEPMYLLYVVADPKATTLAMLRIAVRTTLGSTDVNGVWQPPTIARAPGLEPI